MKLLKIWYDVGDYDHLRFTIRSIESDSERLLKEQRIARFPYFDQIGVLGGWRPRYIVANAILAAFAITFLSYVSIWATLLYLSVYATYGTESRRKAALMERDVARVFKVGPEQRSTEIAKIILAHDHYFHTAYASSRKVHGHFRSVRFMNWVERILMNFPALLYGAGLSLLWFGEVFVSATEIVAGTLFLFGAVAFLPFLIWAQALADSRRREIPGLMRQDEVSNALEEDEVEVLEREASDSDEGQNSAQE